MKRNYISKVIVLYFVLFLSSSCNTELKDWEEVKKIHTIEAYEQFSIDYSESKLKFIADSCISAIMWDSVKTNDNINEYISFLNKYSNSNYKDSAILIINENIQTLFITYYKRISEILSEGSVLLNFFSKTGEIKENHLGFFNSSLFKASIAFHYVNNDVNILLENRLELENHGIKVDELKRFSLETDSIRNVLASSESIKLGNENYSTQNTAAAEVANLLKASEQMRETMRMINLISMVLDDETHLEYKRDQYIINKTIEKWEKNQIQLN